MKSLSALSLVSLAVSLSATAYAQDPTKVDPTHYKLLLENPSVRVLSVSYAAGATSKMHQHPDSIVVMLGDAKVRFTSPDGNSVENAMANETALYTPADTHNPANIGKTAVNGILVEFKAKAPGTATLPASRTGMTLKTLAEGPRALAYRSTAAGNFAETKGTKHDFDQVVISLADAKMSLAIDGQPEKSTWARGDVMFVGRGVAHESKNTGGKPLDMVVVAIK